MDEFEKQIRDVYRNQNSLDSLDKIECVIFFEDQFGCCELTEEQEEELNTSVITLDDAVAFFKKLAP